jgi:cytochrome c oxidase subunit 3
MQIPHNVEPRPDTGLYNAKLGLWLFLASEVMLFGALFSAYILLRVGSPEWPQGLLNVPVGTVNTFVLIVSSITVVMAWSALKTKDFAGFKLYQGATVLLAITFLAIKSFEYRDKFTHYYVKFTEGTEVKELTGHIAGKPFNWTLATLTHPTKPIAEIMFHPDSVEGHPGEGPVGAAMKIPANRIQQLESFGPWRNTFFSIYFVLTGLHALHVIGGILVLGYFWGPGSRMWLTEPERFTNRVEIGGLYWHFVELVWVFLFPTLYLL